MGALEEFELGVVAFEGERTPPLLLGQPSGEVEADDARAVGVLDVGDGAVYKFVPLKCITKLN